MPKDPVMLLSYVNMHLRDQFATLEDFCRANNVDRRTIMEKLAKVDYFYDPESNQFK